MSELRHSALYLGRVRHRRFAPRAHAFTYDIGLLYLDLDEQGALYRLSALAGSSRLAPFGFREQDYLPAQTRAGQPLKAAVLQRVSEALGYPLEGPVRLLTQPRSWGLAFNPASFFYCYDAQERLQAILCEVSNTPWRERYQYVLRAEGEGHQRVTVTKAFHVSPFLPRDLEYHMRYSPVGERLGIHMEDWQAGHKLFDASLDLSRVPLNRGALHRYLWRFPWSTGKTLLAIYWQALRLLLKRIPLFDHQPALGQWRVAHPLPKETVDEKL